MCTVIRLIIILLLSVVVCAVGTAVSALVAWSGELVAWGNGQCHSSNTAAHGNRRTHAWCGVRRSYSALLLPVVAAARHRSRRSAPHAPFCFGFGVIGSPERSAVRRRSPLPSPSLCRCWLLGTRRTDREQNNDKEQARTPRVPMVADVQALFSSASLPRPRSPQCAQRHAAVTSAPAPLFRLNPPLLLSTLCSPFHVLVVPSVYRWSLPLPSPPLPHTTAAAPPAPRLRPPVAPRLLL